MSACRLKIGFSTRNLPLKEMFLSTIVQSNLDGSVDLEATAARLSEELKALANNKKELKRILSLFAQEGYDMWLESLEGLKNDEK